MSRCAGSGSSSSAMSAEHGDAAAGRAARPGVERGPHRRRVGVVGVVEDDHAGRRAAELHPPGREAGVAEAGRPPPRAARRRPGATASAAAALVAMWAPGHGQRDVGAAPRRAGRERWAGVVVQAEPGDGDVGAGVRAAEGQRGGPRCGRPWPGPCGSPALRMATPSAGSASISSALARATPSMPPTRSVWAGATTRDDADRGPGDLAQLADLTRAPHAHLQDERLGVVGCAEQRDRQPLLVVERSRVGGRPASAPRRPPPPGPSRTSCRPIR